MALTLDPIGNTRFGVSILLEPLYNIQFSWASLQKARTLHMYRKKPRPVLGCWELVTCFFFSYPYHSVAANELATQWLS